MKKFFINVLIRMIIFLFTLFLIFVAFAYIFSIKHNISFENTISYFQDIVNEIVNNKNSTNIPVNTNTTIDNPTIQSYSSTYYYNQLDVTSKKIYDSLKNNIDNFKKDNFVINFSTSFNDLLNETSGQYKLNRAFQSALDAFSYDHPELFYIDLSKISLNIKSIAIGNIKTYTVEIVPKDNKNYLISDFNSSLEVEQAIEKVENIKNNIIASISNEEIYYKIKNVHDILVDSIEYDTTLNSSNTHNIYGALVNGKVVCEGYAKAFKYILNSLNIECILVSGTATNSNGETESHMWNYVKIDNSWYGVDVTWDDPIIIGGNNKNNLRHNYFLRGYRTFIDSHNYSGKISDTGIIFTLPSLSDKNYK